jgi:hypothetical protein
MNFHNPAQSYFRPMAHSRFRRQLRSQNTLSLWGDRAIWLSVGKILLALCPLVLFTNIMLASKYKHLEASVQAVENSRLELMDKQITLRTARAQLYSPEQIQMLAAEKLALHVPGKEQIKVF